MIPKNRTTIASLIVGGVGAFIAGLYGFTLWQNPQLSGKFISFLAAIITGFLSCFLISKLYLRFMRDKSWQRGILFGPLFAGLAGAISRAITGMTAFSDTLLLGAVGGMLWVGIPTGVAVGLISSLIFGAIRYLVRW